MNTVLADWANIATIVVTAVAVVALVFTIANLSVFKRRTRYDVMVSLINQITSVEERHNRATIHRMWDDEDLESRTPEAVTDGIVDLIRSAQLAESKPRTVLPQVSSKR